MAINFPNAPAVGAVFSAGGVDFVWNGTIWLVLAPSNATFATKAEAEAGVRDDVFLSPLRAKEAVIAQTPTHPVPAMKCFAWCRFVCLTKEILSSRNIASITDDGGVGLHRITFITPPPDALYVIMGQCRGVTNHATFMCGLSTSFPNTAASCRFVTGTTGGSTRGGFVQDGSIAHASFWR